MHARGGNEPLKRLAALALIAMLAGCNSLPVIVPDMSRHANRAVQLAGTRGPLTPQQSRAVLQRLERSGAPTGIFERHLALEEEFAGSPLLVGNKVMLLQDGPATFQAMFAAIRGARDHIHLETYIIEDDDVGRQFADALIERQSGGVQVTLMYDSVGSIGTPAAFFERLIAAGVRVVEFNPVNPLTAARGWEVNRRDHRKILIVDGRIAFVGGINISSVYSPGSARARSANRVPGALPWRDTHLQVEGPVVAQFQRLFLASWEKQKGEALAPREFFPTPVVVGRDVVRAIGSSPDEPLSHMYATLISAIGSAETSVHLTNAYFVPDPQLLAALIEAARRGVDVKVIVPSSTDSGLVFHAGRRSYAQLLAGGVKLYQRRGGMLHAKTALIDGVWSTVGSTNLDWRSFLHNDEANAVVLGPEFGAQMQAAFAADLAASDPITVESWAQRPLADRMREFAAGVWEYWL